MDRLPDIVKAVRSRSDVSLLELLQGPEQTEVLDRLLALTTLLEGHAEHVMDEVGPAVVPSVEVIRRRFSARRRGGGPVDRLLRVLLGVQARISSTSRAGCSSTRSSPPSGWRVQRRVDLTRDAAAPPRDHRPRGLGRRVHG